MACMNWLQRSKYGYLWLTLIFFLLSLIGHWLFGWFAYVNEQHAFNAPVSVGDYAVEMTRDTLENWQIAIPSAHVAGRWACCSFLRRIAAIEGERGAERSKDRRDPRNGGS
jgi:hypothetical protein